MYKLISNEFSFNEVFEFGFGSTENSSPLPRTEETSPTHLFELPTSIEDKQKSQNNKNPQEKREEEIFTLETDA